METIKLSLQNQSISPLIKPLKIGDIELKNNVLLAPLAGYTDIAFRRLCRDFGASLTTTEMISCKGICYNNAQTIDMLKLAGNENPSCVQLFGSKAEFFEKALALPLLKNFDIFDINMGCPMRKVTKNGDGSALMSDPYTAAKIVETTTKTGRPVTVKIRTGIGSNSRNCVVFAKSLESAGASLITVHGRTAEEMYMGEADWNIIGEVASALSIPVVGNGDIKNTEMAISRLQEYKVSGVMIGRGALGHPEIFSQLVGNAPPTKLEIILKHIDYMTNYFSEHYVVSNIRKHLAYYLKGVPDTKSLKNEINSISSIILLRDKLTEILT